MTAREIIGKARARAKGLTRYYTGEPCSKGHISERYTKSSACCQCSKDSARERNQRPEVKIKAAQKRQDKIAAMTDEEIFFMSEKKAEYIDNNRARINDTARRWRKEYLLKPENKVITLMRSRVLSALKGQEKPSSTLEMIGCSKEDLVKHLESQFRDGMTWDNQGSRWHIDHIVPITKFDLSKEDEAKKANHFTNLRPLLWHENVNKSNKENWCLDEYKEKYPLRYSHPWYTCESWER